MKKEKIVPLRLNFPVENAELDNSFIFNGPRVIEIKSSVSGQKNYCTLDGNLWSWKYAGNGTNIDWDSLDIPKSCKEILKAFLFHRLPRLSPNTIIRADLRWILFLNRSEFRHSFPWQSRSEIEKILSQLRMQTDSSFYGFKAFYDFGVSHGINGFYKELNAFVQEAAMENKRNGAYQKVLLNEINMLSPDQESILLDYLNYLVPITDYVEFRNNVILHLAFELAPRPIQIHSLSNEDFDIIDNPSSEEKYYSLWLPMAKKRNVNLIEKRNRKITPSLGEKITLLINENKNRFVLREPGHPIFLNPKFHERADKDMGRLSSMTISDIICQAMQDKGFDKGEGAILLRHHLAQSLADQGASAETIAEILGHNSTLPARAYIAATPEIATIKTRALGKNRTYEKIMSMLLTGKIIDRNDSNKERWVKGMVGSQYIGGIGACGLLENTACPKNPVYACYTCVKFHPFRDGTHQEVRENLQKHAQFFIDIAEKGMSLEHNRTFTQLERTIEAVNAVINRIKGDLQ